MDEEQKNFDKVMTSGLLIGSIVAGLFTFVLTKGIYDVKEENKEVNYKILQKKSQTKIDSLDYVLLELEVEKAYNKLIKKQQECN